MSLPENSSPFSQERTSSSYFSAEIVPLPVKHAGGMRPNQGGMQRIAEGSTQPITIARGGLIPTPGNSTHSTSPLSQFPGRIGCYYQHFPEASSLFQMGTVSNGSVDEDTEDDVQYVFLQAYGSGHGSPKERKYKKDLDTQGIDTDHLKIIQGSTSTPAEARVGNFFSEIMADDVYLTQFLSAFPKGGDTHCHLTGALDANTYLRYAVSLDLICDTETFIFRKKGDGSELQTGTVTALEIMSNFSLQSRYYQKATTRGQSVETGLTHHHFFETFPVFESIEKYLKLSQLMAPLLKEACDQKVFYLEMSKGFEFDLDLLLSAPRYPARWEEQSVCGPLELGLDSEPVISGSVSEESSIKLPVVQACKKTLYLSNFPIWERFDNKLLPIKELEQDLELKEILDSKLEILLPYLDAISQQFSEYLNEADTIPKELLKYGFNGSLFSLANPTIVKLNVDVNRELPLPAFFADLAVAFYMADLEMRRQNPRIVGIVLSGREHHENALFNRTAQLKMIRYFKHRMPHVRISLHAGELTEALVPKQAMRGAIRKAIKIGTPNRIGHAVSLPHDKNMFELLNILKSRKICVEICFTSNEKTLKVVNGSHPFKKFLSEGIPVTINTDDAGVNGSSLANEFKIAATRYKLTYDQLKRLARNQIKYSFLAGEEIFDEEFKLKECFLPLKECQTGKIKFDGIGMTSEAEALLGTSPKASLQYKLEIAFIKFEEWVMAEMLQNVIRLEEQQ